jgi:hypothetical protein
MKRNYRAIAVLSTALLVAPILAVSGVATPDASAATPTRVLACTESLASKPTTYTLSCADANAGWTAMTWSAWSATAATGHGILRQNDCTPNCAAGKFINYRATVTLSKVVTTKKYGRVFSEALFRYTVGGMAKTETFDLND